MAAPPQPRWFSLLAKNEGLYLNPFVFHPLPNPTLNGAPNILPISPLDSVSTGTLGYKEWDIKKGFLGRESLSLTELVDLVDFSKLY